MGGEERVIINNNNNNNNTTPPTGIKLELLNVFLFVGIIIGIFWEIRTVLIETDFILVENFFWSLRI